jgi:hypothetical protein
MQVSFLADLADLPSIALRKSKEDTNYLQFHTHKIFKSSS